MVRDMTLDDLQVEMRRSRPPTAVYPDRRTMARYRDDQYPATSAAWPMLYVLNLEGGFFAPGALKDLVVPLAEAIRGGKHGDAVLMVVASDDATVDFLEAMATRYSLSFFIASSPAAPLSEARPAGPLTAAEAAALELLLQAGGSATSAMVAHAAGIEVNAAVNRLRGVAQKGYAYRIPRARREGDLFVDPRIAADRGRFAKAEAAVVADRDQFDLDAEALAAWEAINARPARDLPGLRRLMERPSPFTD
jgi:hypothetical protein